MRFWRWIRCDLIMKKGFFIKLVLFNILFSYVQLAFAVEFYLPKPSGLYSVGTKAIEIDDFSRSMFRDGNPRRWMVQAFYPSESHEGFYSYMPGTLDEGRVEGTQVFASAKLNAVPIHSQKFPIIIFIPGLGEERQKYTILCEALASEGYVVLALDQPYVANFVKFSDGTKIVLTLKDVWKIPRDRDYRYQYFDDAMEGAIKDVTYMLDHLKEINLHSLGGVGNLDIIILMGHSFGGNVAHTLGFRDSRVKMVVDIDSKITERKIFGRVGVPSNPQAKPVLFIRGMMQYQEDDVIDQLAKISNSSVWAPQVEHSAFSDKAYFSSKLEGFGNKGFLLNFQNWLLKSGPYWSKIDTGLGGENVDDWFVEYPSYVIEWIKVQEI